jgi:hypothetical protein
VVATRRLNEGRYRQSLGLQQPSRWQRIGHPMAATPTPTTADLRARAVELCARAAELRVLAARLRVQATASRDHLDLDARVGELSALCAELDDCSYELHVCASEVHRRTPRSPEEKSHSKTKPKRMTPTQADVARRLMSSPDGVLRPIGFGRWGFERRRRKNEWSTTVMTVRAMDAHGWLERAGHCVEAWRDSRRLTEAGKVALSAAEEARRRLP